jgi:hypothetical protein
VHIESEVERGVVEAVRTIQIGVDGMFKKILLVCEKVVAGLQVIFPFGDILFASESEVHSQSVVDLL